MERRIEPSELAQCVGKARAGDSSAWREIDRRIREEVVSRLALPPSVDPEEVASDTVADVWRALESLRDSQKALNFAMTVARRVAARKRKESERHCGLASEPAAPDADVGPKVIEGGELLDSVSRILKASDRQLFRLLYVVGASSEEAQAHLGISGKLFRQRKHRLHQRLRSSLPPL